MPARKYDYYESGSTAKKIEYEYNHNKRNKSVNRNKVSNKKAKKTRTSSVIMVLCIFSMALVLVYRYNVINEKNLESQALANDLSKIEATLFSSQMDVELNTDLNQIEDYAKQKLGMQKPDKNQTIYVDTSKSSNLVKVKNDTSFIQNVTEKISEFFNKIF